MDSNFKREVDVGKQSCNSIILTFYPASIHPPKKLTSGGSTATGSPVISREVNVYRYLLLLIINLITFRRLYIITCIIKQRLRRRQRWTCLVLGLGSCRSPCP